MRPLNARLVREFIKFPAYASAPSSLAHLAVSTPRPPERSGRWEVNGKSSPEGDQAVLLPSEAAQGYLLPVRSAHAVDRVAQLRRENAH